MKLDLHIHTKTSFDCESDIREVVETAEKIGLNAIAITDHDSMAAIDEARKYATNLTIIPGMEITSEGGAHFLGLFLKKEIKSKKIFDIIDEVHAQNGLIAIAHPFRPGTGLLFNRDNFDTFSGDEISKIMSRIDLVESINYRACADELVNVEQYFSSMPDIPRIAGSDAHHIDEIGKATLELEEFDSSDLNEIKEALLNLQPIFRYEAYSADYKIKTTTMKSGNRTLILKTRELVQDSILNPIQKIYQKTKSRILNDIEEYENSKKE